MKPYKTQAHINSLSGKMDEITVLDKVGDSDYIVNYKGVKCHALFIGSTVPITQTTFTHSSRRFNTMAKLAELKKYLNYEFSTGCYTGEDYKSFQAKYINYLKAMCKENHWQLVNVSRNHYCFSAFIQSSQNKFVYISISDVRYFSNEWYDNILIRTAKNEVDYRGGFNHYTSLEHLVEKAAELLDDMPF